MNIRTIQELLGFPDKNVARLASLIQQISDALEAKTITQSECDELVADMEQTKKLIDDSVSLSVKIDLAHHLVQLYEVLQVAKNLLPLA